MSPSKRLRTLLGLMLLCGVASALPVDGRAQNNRYTQRSYVTSPTVLGMGDAGIARPGIERGFFYNPAHLSGMPSHFTILGIQGSANRSLPDQIQFFNQEVAPVLESNFDLSTGALADLHREAFRLSRRPGRGHGAVLLPSFVYSPGALGVGAGLFAKTALNYRIEDAGAGIPSVWLLNRTDVMALLSLGLDLRIVGLPELSVGITGTQTRRMLVFKTQPLDLLTENETATFLHGSVFQLDAGAVYTPDWVPKEPGTFRVAASVYDLLPQSYGYRTGEGEGRMPFIDTVVDQLGTGQQAASSTDTEDEDRRTFSLRPSYRIGVAYEQFAALFLEDVALALDVQGYGQGAQSLLARLHMGASAQVAGPLRLRTGLSAGYPSGGVGIRVGAMHLDYSVHGVEEGRKAGDLGTYAHTVRLLFRLQ